MAHASPYELFVARAFEEVWKDTQRPTLQAHAQRLYGLTATSGFERAQATLAILDALPPPPPRQCKRVLEMLLFALPGPDMACGNHYHQAVQVAGSAAHAGFFEKVNQHIERLLQLGNIDPLSPLALKPVASRLDPRGTFRPLCLVAQELGHPQLLDQAARSLPQELRGEAVKLCGQNARVETAEKILAAAPLEQREALYKTLWCSLGGEGVVRSRLLPGTSPPVWWWATLGQGMHADAAQARVGSVYPQAMEGRFNAWLWNLRLDLPDIANALPKAGKDLWQTREGHWESAMGAVLVACAWGRVLGDGDFSQSLHRRMRALVSVLPSTGERDGRSQAWWAMGYWLSLPEAYRTKPDCWGGSIREPVQSIVQQGYAGLENQAQILLACPTPATCAVVSTALRNCAMAHPECDIETFASTSLERVRAWMGSSMPDAQKWACVSAFLSPWFKKEGTELHPWVQHVDASLPLEAVLWKTTVSRLKQREEHTTDNFPLASLSEKQHWKNALAWVNAGVEPCMPQVDAQCLYQLVEKDTKMPEALRVCLQARALRVDGKMAPSSLRRM